MPAPITFSNQTGWKRFHTLLVYRKYPPSWANKVFFAGCALMFVTLLAFSFYSFRSDQTGLPKLVEAFIGACILTLPACFIWGFILLLVVAMNDYMRGHEPELENLDTLLLRSLRNIIGM